MLRKKSLKEIKKGFLFILVGLICIAFCGCALFKSDEEKIEDRIDSFLSAYNTGDLDAVLECMDAKTRNKFKAAKNLTENIGGALLGKATGLGLGVSLSDLFGLGVGTMSDDDLMKIDISEIHITDKTHATVDVVLEYNDKMSSTKDNAVFTMLKEKGDWYIKDLEKQ